MSKTDPKSNDINLTTGDLIVNTESQIIGILMEKHRLLRSSSADPDRAWEWAWSIRWSDNNKPEKFESVPWIKFHACSENSILEEIRKGYVVHYSVD